MLLEAREAPDCVARQLAADAAGYRDFGAALRERPPASMLTLARGSSDHAAHFMAYLIMARLGRLVTSLPMSLLEAALKFKETCAIQVEAFSGAEVQHGPMALIGAGFPLLVFAPRGPAQAGLLTLAAQMRERGARVLLAAPAGTEGCELPIVEAGSPELDPVCAIQSFYPLVEALARAGPGPRSAATSEEGDQNAMTAALTHPERVTLNTQRASRQLVHECFPLGTTASCVYLSLTYSEGSFFRYASEVNGETAALM